MTDIETRVGKLEKKVAELERQLTTRPVQIKTVFHVDETLIGQVNEIVNYINKTILPMLNYLIERVPIENQPSEEVFPVQPSEPPAIKN